METLTTMNGRAEKKIRRGYGRHSEMEREKQRTKWEEGVRQWKTLIQNMTAVKKMKEVLEEKRKVKKENTKNTQHDEWFGDKLNISKEWPKKTKENTVRIYGHNVNGVSCAQNYSEWEIMLEHLNDRQIDIACLTEINLDIEKSDVKFALYEKAKRLDKGMNITLTASKDGKHDRINKRGGIITMTRGNWSGRIINSGSEKMGRWTYVTLQGKKNRKLTIYTIYRACNQKHQEGTCTIYMQQEQELIKAGRKDTDPREAILADLTMQIQKDTQKDHDIIVIGDVNEDLYNNKRIEQFLADNNLYNVIKEKHKGNGPATYDRGTKCLDLVAATNTIDPEAIQKCGYFPFYEGILSDHRASYIDIRAD